MSAQVEHLRREIQRRLGRIGRKELLSVSRYIRLVEESGPIDLDQTYFWSRAWQRLERLAERSKSKRKIVGDGTAEGLVRALRA